MSLCTRIAQRGWFYFVTMFLLAQLALWGANTVNHQFWHNAAKDPLAHNKVWHAVSTKKVPDQSPEGRLAQDIITYRKHRPVTKSTVDKELPTLSGTFRNENYPGLNESVRLHLFDASGYPTDNFVIMLWRLEIGGYSNLQVAPQQPAPLSLTNSWPACVLLWLALGTAAFCLALRQEGQGWKYIYLLDQRSLVAKSLLMVGAPLVFIPLSWYGHSLIRKGGNDPNFGKWVMATEIVKLLEPYVNTDKPNKTAVEMHDWLPSSPETTNQLTVS